MGYIDQYFGKDEAQITYADIVNYFVDEKEESDKIEFKAYVAGGSDREKEDGIIRTISGMLNSEGGLIIWGAPVGKSIRGKSEKVFQGTLSPVQRAIGKDYLINRITDSITPSPNSVSFVSLQNGSDYVYLFEIESSQYSPHQFKNIYNMRIDGQTRPAPHHYIDALFKKISFPNLECYLRIDSYNPLEDNMAFMNCSLIFCNQSPFQNDFNLQYRIYSSHGAVIKFDESLTGISSKYMLKNSGDLLNKQFADTIFYGQWLHEEFKVVLSKETLHDYSYELEIRIQFGARFSPLKICYYKIVIGERIHKKLYDHIILKTENRLYNVAESEMEKSSKLRLDETLGR